MGGAAVFRNYIRALENKFGSHLILLDAGDIFQGTLESNLNRGRAMIQFYNLLPLKGASIGNHEFDFGERYPGGDKTGVLQQRIAEANFPFLAANIYDRNTGDRINWQNVYESVLVQVEGIKVGIIGLTTEDTPKTTRRINIKNIKFGDMKSELISQSETLRQIGADVVLLTTHEGHIAPGEALDLLLKNLPAKTVDAVVSGHAHQKYNQLIHGIPVIQSFAKGKYFGRIDLFVDRKTKKINKELTFIHPVTPICEKWFRSIDTCNARAANDYLEIKKGSWKSLFPTRLPIYLGKKIVPDRAVEKLLEPYVKRANKFRIQKIGIAARPIKKMFNGDCEVGTFFLKAIGERFPKIKAFYLNGGGFRRGIPKGAITYQHLFETYPFDNDFVEVQLTGKELRTLMEIATSGRSRHKPNIWGFQLTFRAGTGSFGPRDQNGDGKFEIWERNRLISINWPDGTPIADDDRIDLLTIDFLVEGGNGMDYVFDRIPKDRIRVLRGIQVRDVVLEWLRKNRRPINSKRYPLLSAKTQRLFVKE